MAQKVGGDSKTVSIQFSISGAFPISVHKKSFLDITLLLWKKNHLEVMDECQGLLCCTGIFISTIGYPTNIFIFQITMQLLSQIKPFYKVIDDDLLVNQSEQA